MASSASSQSRAVEQATSQYLTFFIAGEEYALSILRVREVIPYDDLTRVPGAPEVIRGVTNLRGSVVPVVDLALKFRLPETPLTTRTCVVIVELAIPDMPEVMGIMTEAVGQVVMLAPDQIEPVPPFGTPIRTDYLAGMGKMGKKFALLLDLDKLLTATEIATVLEPPAPPAPPPAPAPPQEAPTPAAVHDWLMPETEIT